MQIKEGLIETKTNCIHPQAHGVRDCDVRFVKLKGSLHTCNSLATASQRDAAITVRFLRNRHFLPLRHVLMYSLSLFYNVTDLWAGPGTERGTENAYRVNMPAAFEERFYFYANFQINNNASRPDSRASSILWQLADTSKQEARKSDFSDEWLIFSWIGE